MTNTQKQAADSGALTLSMTGRHAAGEDPAKREQILDGAKRVFIGKGFDASSMNDVAREAGVSKGTIYVYFQNKEDLFADLIERERTRFALSTRDALENRDRVEDALFHFGMTFCQHMMNDDVICSMRSVIGVIDRMPGLARRFFSSESVNVRSILRDYLDAQQRQGTLSIEDTDIASRQLIDMCSGSYFKLRLFGELKQSPPREELDRVIGSAVRVFMAAYRPTA